MNLTPWAPAIALAGVVLGVVVTFIGQILTRRQASILSVDNQKAALRSDRREAIYRFLEAAAPVYELVSVKAEYSDLEFRDKMDKAQADLWFRQRCIDVVCRPELRKAASRYAKTLEQVLFRGLPTEGLILGDYIADFERDFFDLARKELYAPKVSD